MMVKNMLLRAICCAGVALLPPSFDGMPVSGVGCLDLRMLRPRLLGPERRDMCADFSSDSAS